MRAFRAGHAGRDRRQHQNALQSCAKNENAYVEERNRRTRVWLCWMRRAVSSAPLPHDHSHNRDRCGENANPKNDPPRALALTQSSRTHDVNPITVVNRLLPVSCVFLAAICASTCGRCERRRVFVAGAINNVSAKSTGCPSIHTETQSEYSGPNAHYLSRSP